ncbi:MAG: 16S rRNA (guanine(527)-N(7))-methyltransferase RsmG [Pseudomonadota bacterium]
MIPQHLDVSRETEAKLHAFVDLVQTWSRAINLVGRKDLSELWSRHVIDSAQLLPLAGTSAGTWLDLGSGGGFPGFVIALLGQARGLSVTLVESDSRKAEFLRSASRTLTCPVAVLAQRIEDTTPQNADVVSARALAPLTRLLHLAQPHRHSGTLCLFPKGQSFQKELEEARREWHVGPDIIRSETDPSAVILKIGAYGRAKDRQAQTALPDKSKGRRRQDNHHD